MEEGSVGVQAVKIARIREFIELLRADAKRVSRPDSLGDRLTNSEIRRDVACVKAMQAIEGGRTFLIPRSLYRDYRRPYAPRPPAHNQCHGLRLPYGEVVFAELEDDPTKPTYGLITAFVVAYEDGNIFPVAANVDHMDGGSTVGVQSYFSDYAYAFTEVALASLRAKNFTKELVEVPAKVLAKRQRTGKSVPTHSFTVIRPPGSNQCSARTSTSGTVPSHWVRGHWKRRATGMFFWTSHVAGSGPTRSREGYLVRRPQ
jgi:hypothetical protein